MYFTEVADSLVTTLILYIYYRMNSFKPFNHFKSAVSLFASNPCSIAKCFSEVLLITLHCFKVNDQCHESTSSKDKLKGYLPLHTSKY